MWLPGYRLIQPTIRPKIDESTVSVNLYELIYLATWLTIYLSAPFVLSLILSFIGPHNHTSHYPSTAQFSIGWASDSFNFALVGNEAEALQFLRPTGSHGPVHRCFHAAERPVIRMGKAAREASVSPSNSLPAHTP